MMTQQNMTVICLLRLQSNGVANSVSRRLSSLSRYSVSHRNSRNAARLGAQQPAGLALFPGLVQQILWYLGGLTTTSLATDEHHLVA